MPEILPLVICAVVVIAIVIAIGGRLKLSSRYERKPRVLNTWNAQDQGIDPTDEKNL